MIDYTVKNPDKFITTSGTTYTDWAVVSNNYLWGNSAASDAFPKMTKTYKSIFDPSPEGYRVAPRDLCLNFTTTSANAGADSKGNYNVVGNENQDGAGSYNKGWTFYIAGTLTGATDYYIGSGRRNYDDGGVSNVGTGFYWNSATIDNRGCNIRLGASYVYPLDAYYRAYGFPVRCVQE